MILAENLPLRSILSHFSFWWVLSLGIHWSKPCGSWFIIMGFDGFEDPVVWRQDSLESCGVSQPVPVLSTIPLVREAFVVPSWCSKWYLASRVVVHCRFNIVLTSGDIEKLQLVLLWVWVAIIWIRFGDDIGLTWFNSTREMHDINDVWRWGEWGFFLPRFLFCDVANSWGVSLLDRLR